MRIWVSTLMILALAMAVFVGPARVVVAQDFPEESQQIQPRGEAVECGKPRGQGVAVCVTNPITLYANLTAAAKDVTGDIVVAAASCSVRITGGVGGPHTIPGGTDVGFTVTVPAGTRLTGQCIATANKNQCRWVYTRTSP